MNTATENTAQVNYDAIGGARVTRPHRGDDVYLTPVEVAAIRSWLKASRALGILKGIGGISLEDYKALAAAEQATETAALNTLRRMAADESSATKAFLVYMATALAADERRNG